MKWIAKHPRATEGMLGFLTVIFDENDMRPAKDQIADRYKHGGGFWPIRGFEMHEDHLQYPDDPPFPLLFEAKLHDETIRFYLHSYVAIVQSDGSFVVCRMD